MDKRDQVVRSQVNKPLSDRVGSRLRHKKGIKGTVWSKHHKTSEKDWNSDISWTTLWGLITNTSHKHQGQLAACQRELATCGLLWTLLEDHVPLFELSKILAMKSYVASFSLRGAYAWLTLSKFWLTRREFSQDAYAKLTQKSFHQFGQPQYNESLRKVSDLLCRSLFRVRGGRKRRRMRLTEYMRHRPEKAQEEIHDGD